MMGLFGSEMTRLASRRLFRWLLILFIGFLVLGAVIVFVNDNGTFSREQVADGLIGLAFPLLMFSWLVGASAIGAEWGNRTVSALLTWEPRRSRVLVTKAAAAAVSTALWVIALEIVWTAVMMPVANDGGGFTGGMVFSWGEYVGFAGRILAVCVIASVLGFSLATIGKNTGAALGGGMAYLLIVESLVRAYLPDWDQWLLSTNIVRVAERGADVAFDGVTAEAAALRLVAYAVGLFLVALAVFDRREMA